MPPSSTASSPQTPQIAQNVSAQTLPQDTSRSWKSYRDDKLGLSFNYPAEWGEAVVGNGDEALIEVPPCKGSMMKTYLGKPYPWGLYSASVKFSRSPINLEIKLLDLNVPNIPKIVCSSDGEKLTLSSIQPQTQSGEVYITNKAGIKFVFDSSLFSSIDTDLEGPVYTTRHNDKLVWISSGYTPYANTPQEQELREKYIDNCGTQIQATNKECGIVAWANTGVTAVKVREGFSDLKEVIQTFVVTP